MFSITSPVVLQVLFFLPYASIGATGIALITANTLFFTKVVGFLHVIFLLGYLVGAVGNHSIKVYSTFIDLCYLLWSTGAAPLLDVQFSQLGVYIVLQLFWLPKIVYLIMVVMIPSCSVIVPGKLILGNGMASVSSNMLNSYGVTHILEIRNDTIIHSSAFPINITLLQLNCSDDIDADNSLLNVSKVGIEFINKALQEKDALVLIYCSDGVSRSPLVVVQWLLSTGHVESVQAGYALVRTARPVVDVNKMQLNILDATQQKSFKQK
jgi:protein-tyrosine phosphatase